MRLRYQVAGGCGAKGYRCGNGGGGNGANLYEGVPEELLTDQGANFTSGLMKEVHRLLG